METSNANAAYDRWHDGLQVDDGISDPWHLLVSAYLDRARDLRDRRVLEIGCGRGGFSMWLAGQAEIGEQIAIDFSEVAVAKARAHALSKGLQSIQWRVGDIQAIDQPNDSFDTIVSCETIEHVPDPPRAVSELARVLKPNGKLFLSTPNYLGTLGLYRGYLRLRGRTFTEVGQPINQFTTVPGVLLWIRQAGLRVLTVDGVGHYLPVPGRPAVRLRQLDNMRFLSRWLAHHTLYVATKVR